MVGQRPPAGISSIDAVTQEEEERPPPSHLVGAEWQSRDRFIVECLFAIAGKGEYRITGLATMYGHHRNVRHDADFFPVPLTPESRTAGPCRRSTIRDGDDERKAGVKITTAARTVR